MSDRPTIEPTNRDVINGRGRGMQSVPGNVKYRKLVAANKELYARCPDGCKIEVSKGIVNAVRNFQGRFLDLDKQTCVYFDIGDEAAIKKTSQALREGQNKLRQLIHGKCKDEMAHTPEEYFAYSVRVLSHLYSNDLKPDLLVNEAQHMQLPPPPVSKKSQNKHPPIPPLPKTETMSDTGIASSKAVKMALDQFPMASASIVLSKDKNKHMMYFNNQHHGQNEQVPYSRSHYSDISMASLSTISEIHTISSGQSSKSSIPKGFRGSFDTFVTAQSHQKILEKEKHHYMLDFIDEATTCYDETTRMSYTALPEEYNQPTMESTHSNYSLMNTSVGDFSMGSDTVNNLIREMIQSDCSIESDFVSEVLDFNGTSAEI